MSVPSDFTFSIDLIWNCAEFVGALSEHEFLTSLSFTMTDDNGRRECDNTSLHLMTSSDGVKSYDFMSAVKTTMFER